jgi:hypothetical protein
MTSSGRSPRRRPAAEPITTTEPAPPQSLRGLVLDLALLTTWSTSLRHARSFSSSSSSGSLLGFGHRLTFHSLRGGARSRSRICHASARTFITCPRLADRVAARLASRDGLAYREPLEPVVRLHTGFWDRRNRWQAPWSKPRFAMYAASPLTELLTSRPATGSRSSLMCARLMPPTLKERPMHRGVAVAPARS